MKSRLVKIGNSRGVRLPKSLIEEAGLTEEVEISSNGDQLLIRSRRKPRQDWSRSFQEMAERGDDALLDGNRHPLTRWEREDWEWR